MSGHPDNPIADDVEDAIPAKGGLTARLRRYFFTGIVVTAPITLTLWVAWWFLTLIDDAIAELLPPEYNPNNYLPFEIPGVGLVIAIAFFILVGWFARNFLGRMIIRLSDVIVRRLPIISTIYNALKQVFDMTMGEQSKAFRDVVAFQYPRAGAWTIGFVTGRAPAAIQKATGEEMLNVYFPATPTTAGLLLFLPKKDLVYLPMNVEEAVKLVVSGGIILPPEKP